MSQAPPNIVIICSDQHRAASIGCYGNPVCRTPNLDRLAAGGVQFDRCFSPNPVCSPARASLLTGCSSRRNGVPANGFPLRHDLPTLADALKAGGYATAAIGKMHLTPQNEGVPTAPFYGFDHFESTEDPKIGPYLDWALREFPEHEGYIIGTLFNLPTSDDYWCDKRDMRQEYLEQREKHVVPHEISASCNWGYGHYSPLPPEALQSTWITDRAIACVEAHDASQPLLLWAGYVDPHNPFDPPDGFQQLYSPDTVDERLRREGEEDSWPPHMRAFREHTYAWSDQDFRTLRALYYGSVTYMDEQIGRLLTALETTLDMQNTIVLYTSDHGELLGDHSLHGKWAYHFDSCIRVPLICRWDGHWQAGAKTDEIVELTDIMPSLLEAAGVTSDSDMDGVSFAPLLAGEAMPEARGHAFAESYGGGPDDPTPPPHTWARTIRTKQYRATFYPCADHGELYDLENDPGEFDNLWDDPQHHDVLEEHRRILLDRLIMLDYPLPRRDYAV